MTMQRIVNDKLDFDWGVVAHVCPSYKRFLIDKLSSDYQNNSEKRGQGNATCSNDRQQIDDLVEEIRMVNTPAHMGKIETEEEMKIFREVYMAEGDPAPLQSPNNDGMFPAYEYGHERPVPHDWSLKSEYKENAKSGPVPTVPLLMPPKRYLKNQSSLWLDRCLNWTISSSKYSSDHISNLRKRRIIVTDNKVQLVHAVYYFDKRRNLVSDSKEGLEFLTFSRRLGRIFGTYYEDNKKTGRKRRFNKRIMTCTLSRSAIGISINMWPSNMIWKFVNEVTMMAYKDLGDIFLPSSKNCSGVEDGVNVLYAIMWQYKAGRPLKWAENIMFLENMDKALSKNFQRRHTSLFDPVLGALLHAEEKIHTRIRKRMLARVSKAVKTSDSPKAILKAILGNGYKNVYAEMMLKLTNQSLHELSPLSNIESLLQRNAIPKKFFHVLSNTVRNLGPHNIELFKELLQGAWSWNRFVHHPTEYFYNCVDKYVTLNQRFSNKGRGSVNWGRVFDTFRMAKDYNLRLRINKWEYPDDIRRVHDKLSEFTRRDIEVKYNIPLFLPFPAPDKEYDGFRFVHLDTATKLVNEGKEMKHCVGGYAKQCFEGNSVIFAMKNGRSWVTLELDGSSPDYEILQKYTIGDYAVNSGRINGIIQKWHQDVVLMHKRDALTYREVAGQVGEIIKARRTMSRLSDGDSCPGLDDEVIVQQNMSSFAQKEESLFAELENKGISRERVLSYVEAVEQKVEGKTQSGRASANAYLPW